MNSIPEDTGIVPPFVQSAVQNEDFKEFSRLLKLKHFYKLMGTWIFESLWRKINSIDPFFFLLILLEEGAKICIKDFIKTAEQKWENSPPQRGQWKNRDHQVLWLLAKKVNREDFAKKIISSLIFDLEEDFKTKEFVHFQHLLGNDLFVTLLQIDGCEIRQDVKSLLIDDDEFFQLEFVAKYPPDPNYPPLFLASLYPRQWGPFGGPQWISCDDLLLSESSRWENINKIHPILDITPLGFALLKGNFYVASKLLEMGADMKFTLNNEKFIFDHVSQYFLATRGWSVNPKNNFTRLTASGQNPFMERMKNLALDKIRFLPLQKKKLLTVSLLRNLIFKENKIIF
jgi:hypothetical protein